MFGYPLRSNGSSYEIVQGIEHNEFAQGKINATKEELEMERDAVKELLS